MVYQIALGAALLGAKQFGAAERQLRDTIAQNQDWRANHDLLWSAYHLLVKTLEGEEKTQEAVTASRLGAHLGLTRIRGGTLQPGHALHRGAGLRILSRALVRFDRQGSLGSAPIAG
ncbi:MAG TPA: hypothetical protein VMR62_32115 [Bryobacteraceae bacterium]|jgi:hypothetical protein|nr:hypothetical protein [Bryobacteraceae bacterium]